MDKYLLKKKNRTGILIILILLAGFCLRFAFALTYLPLLGSEINHLPLAKHISFSLNNFYLPLESGITNHLIFTDLVVKLGLVLFGESAIGIRSIFVLIGFFTLIIIYKICFNYSKEAAIYALLLAAFNQYSIGHSGIADNPVIIVFFSALSIYIFWQGINFKRNILWFLGPIWIISYLTQEQIVIFSPMFYLFLLFSSRYRIFSKSREIFFSYFIFFGFVFFHLLLIRFNGTCLEYFTVPGYIQFSRIPTLTGINFFLIRPICRILNLDYLMTVNWEVPLMSALSGVVLFSGIIYLLKNLKVEFIKLLILLAVSQILIFSFIKSDVFIWGEPNWAKLSFIPAVCLAAVMLAKLRRKFRYFKYLIYLLFIYISLQAFIFSFQPKLTYPPHRLATFVDYDTQFIELYIDKEFLDKPSGNSLAKMGIRIDYGKAVNECVKAINICPNEVRIHNYLAEGLYKTGFKRTAEKKWLQSLEIEPFYIKTFESIVLTYSGRGSIFLQDIIYLQNGIQHLRGQKYEEAAVEFKKSGLESFCPGLFHYYLGISYLYKGNLDWAEQELKKAARFNRQFTRARVDLARTFILGKKFSEAEKILKGVIQSNPDYFLAYEYLGELYTSRGDRNLAKTNYNQTRNIVHVTLRDEYYASMLFPNEGLRF
jgi:tetratricopeptide (TPR) repeat protein